MSQIISRVERKGLISYIVDIEATENYLWTMFIITDHSYSSSRN